MNKIMDKGSNIMEYENIISELNEITTSLDATTETLVGLQENAKQNDVVMIQGDFGLSYNLINYAKSLDLIPVYATTKRIAAMHGALKCSMFEHVVFREYK